MNIIIFILVDTIISLVLFMILYYFLFTSKSIKEEKRISKYALTSKNDRELSFFDSLNTMIWNFIHKTGKMLTKGKTMKKVAKYYEKYTEDDDTLISSDCIVIKLLLAFLFMILSILTPLFELFIVKTVYHLLAFIIGFILLDLYLKHKLKIRRETIKNYLLESIVIINNAFKENKNIYQAINIVSKNMYGPIAKEYEIIRNDLSYGLSIDKSFRRFYERIPLDEINYIANILMTINKNGGSEKEAFLIIEDHLKDHQHQKEELVNYYLTSKLIYVIAFIVPIVIFLLFIVLKKGFYNLMFTTHIGLIYLTSIILIYIMYIIIINSLIREQKV